MKSLTRATVLMCLASANPMTAGAAVVLDSELPNSIQSCMASGACFAGPVSVYDSGTAAAFPLSQNLGTATEQNWLMRYTLVPPSAQTRTNPAQTDSLGGYLWMLVKGQYDAAEAGHGVTVFLDKASPSAFGFAGQSGDLSLQLATADLVAGSSYFDAAFTSGNVYASSGNLTGELPPMCLADNCGVHVDLNLLQLSYSDNGSTVAFTGFDPSDVRGLVFGQRSYYQSGDPSTAVNDVQTFQVSAVPLPAALWLFGPALAGLAGWSGRRRIS
jgi:hypothetical protein